jgi:hypothetical protein
MPRGGARPGAGRKPKAEKYQTPIQAAEQRIADRLPELIDRMFDLSKEGDRDATVYLINRVMGKPTERVEAETNNNSTLEVVYVNDWRNQG